MGKGRGNKTIMFMSDMRRSPYQAESQRIHHERTKKGTHWNTKKEKTSSLTFTNAAVTWGRKEGHKKRRNRNLDVARGTYGKDRFLLPKKPGREKTEKRKPGGRGRKRVERRGTSMLPSTGVRNSTSSDTASWLGAKQKETPWVGHSKGRERPPLQDEKK